MYVYYICHFSFPPWGISSSPWLGYPSSSSSLRRWCCQNYPHSTGRSEGRPLRSVFSQRRFMTRPQLVANIWKIVHYITLRTLRQKWTSCCSHNGIYQLPHHSWWVVLVAFACTQRYATWQQGWVLWQTIRCWRWWPAPIERRIMSSNPRVNQGTCAHPPIHVSSMFTPGSQATGRHHSNLHRNDIYEMVGGLYPFVSNHPVVCSSFLCAVLIRWWSWTPSVAVRTTTCMLRFIFGGAAFFLGNNPSQLAPGPRGCYSRCPGQKIPRQKKKHPKQVTFHHGQVLFGHGRWWVWSSASCSCLKHDDVGSQADHIWEC